MKHCAKTVYFVTKRICARTSVWVLAPCHVFECKCICTLCARVYMYIRFISRVTASVCRVCCQTFLVTSMYFVYTFSSVYTCVRMRVPSISLCMIFLVTSLRESVTSIRGEDNLGSRFRRRIPNRSA